jgi:methyl-accepting chemotaxis protein
MKMKLGNQIMLAATGAVALATLFAIGIVYFLSTKNRIDELRGKMSSIIAQSELVASQMDVMYRAKAFDTPSLLASAKTQAQGRPLREIYASTDLYQTIPIVEAWESVAGAAKRGGFEFSIPVRADITARNPDHAFTADYAPMFAAFEKGEPEYFLRDRAHDVLVLARPVRLQASCLACHGDPAKSPTGDGKDVLGFPMENRKVGDLQGAFVLKAKIGHDPVVMATMQMMALGGGLVLIAVLGGFYLFNRRAIMRPLSTAIEQIESSSIQTAAAAREIAGASTSLAEGASEQAASIEETSSSLEEMSSMTKRNSDSSKKTNELAKQTRSAADKIVTDMQGMSTAMGRSNPPRTKLPRSSRPLTRLPSRPTSWRSTPLSKRPGPARRERDLRWWPTKCGIWRNAAPRRPRKRRPRSRTPSAERAGRAYQRQGGQEH